jgi:hypothetical protein
MFSFSLPHAEKSAFEETFKFIIVTSHLINPSLSIHHKTCENETRIIRPKQEQVLPWTCGLSCLFVAEKYYSSLNVPVVTLIISGTVGIFYSLRQKVPSLFFLLLFFFFLRFIAYLMKWFVAPSIHSSTISNSIIISTIID